MTSTRSTRRRAERSGGGAARGGGGGGGGGGAGGRAAPPPGAIPPPLPRSSIAAVLARRGDLELTPGQVEALEAADRELAARLDTLRGQGRSAGRPAGKPGRADGAPEDGAGGVEGPGGGGGPLRARGWPPARAGRP